jgi:predicted O-methyltransferase YrrM
MGIEMKKAETVEVTNIDASGERFETSESLRNAFGYLYPEELPYLKKLVRDIENSPAVVLNIGAGAGTSGLAFAEAREDMILHTCDITNEAHPWGCLESERDWMGWATLDYKWGISWFQHHMSSHDLDDIWAEITGFQTIDLVFIDGDHSHEGAKEDMYGFFPYVRLGGLIAIHDYGKSDLPMNEHDPCRKDLGQVTKAVDDVMPTIAEYYDRCWSTIVYRKPK